MLGQWCGDTWAGVYLRTTRTVAETQERSLLHKDIKENRRNMKIRLALRTKPARIHISHSKSDHDLRTALWPGLAQS